MTEKTIVVLGATGRSGRPLVRALERRGARVRAITRSVDRVTLFSEQVETRVGDLEDVDSLTLVFQGATAIHYIPPSLNPRDPEYMRNIIAAAGRANVARIVYHSVLHPHTPQMPHHMRKAGTELQLRHSPLVWTVIQPAMYAQTALAFFDAIAGELTPAFDPARPFTPIHEEDLAEAVALLHTTEGHEFATYELAGSERLNFFAMGERLSAVLKRQITTRQAPVETIALRFAAARGYNSDQVRELRQTFDQYDHHGLVGNGNVLRMILGREPADFAQAMRDTLLMRR